MDKAAMRPRDPWELGGNTLDPFLQQSLVETDEMRSLDWRILIFPVVYTALHFMDTADFSRGTGMKDFTSLPCSVSKTRTLPSNPPVATSSPLGWNTTV